ncbi:hypothetical protein DFP72DRAFT_847792 [Ephemerocybe angulata]|uniref:Uncharacterized protein n=1 Tax=Ephemerocybe angulata TaxID=980116 RepID=A0A8H6HYA7_9AGAR|nr:hypothetical protein DFP72DRAFT_847792 [Tulosesus angulatus]
MGRKKLYNTPEEKAQHVAIKSWVEEHALTWDYSRNKADINERRREIYRQLHGKPDAHLEEQPQEQPIHEEESQIPHYWVDRVRMIPQRLRKVTGHSLHRDYLDSLYQDLAAKKFDIELA